MTTEIKPKVKLSGTDGNIFALMGRASRELKRAGLTQQAKEMCDKIMESGSYSQAIAIISEYLEVS